MYSRKEPAGFDHCVVGVNEKDAKHGIGHCIYVKWHAKIWF